MIKINLTRHRLASIIPVLFVIDLGFFGSLNTNKVAQYMLVIGFLLLLVNLFVFSYGVTSLIRLYGIPVKKKRLSVYISLFLGLIFALQSIGELSTRDILVMLLLAVIGYGYITYVSMTKQKSTRGL